MYITSNYPFFGVEIVADYNCFDILKIYDIVGCLELSETFGAGFWGYHRKIIREKWQVMVAVAQLPF